MDRESIISLFTRLGSYKIIPYDQNISVSCPFSPYSRAHKDAIDEHPSFSVKINDAGPSIAYCFTCHRKGSLLFLLNQLSRYRNDIGPIIEEVKRIEGDDPINKIARIKEQFIEKKLERIAGGKINVIKEENETWPEDILKPFAGRCPKYLLQRGINLETCKEFEIGYDTQEKRAIFPVRRFGDGALVGIVGRTVLDNGFPRYRDYGGFKKGHYFFGEHKLHLLEDPKKSPIILVEGPIDLLKLWTFGFRNILASLGTGAINHVKAARLKAWGAPIYMALDWDAAGYESREMIKRYLLGRVPLFDIEQPKGRKDPGEIENIDEFLTQYRNAKLVRFNFKKNFFA